MFSLSSSLRIFFVASSIVDFANSYSFFFCAVTLNIFFPIKENFDVFVSFSSMSAFSLSSLRRNLVNSPWARSVVLQNCSNLSPIISEISSSILLEYVFSLNVSEF